MGLLISGYASGAPILDQPEETPITLSVREVSLEKVLKIISDKSGLSFIPDPMISGRPISIELSNVVPQEALRIIAQLYNLGFQNLGTTGKYVVTDKSSIAVDTQIGFYICEFAPADALVEVLQPFLTPEVGSLVVDDRTNMIIYRDTEANNKILRQIISNLDKSSRQIYIKSIIAEVSLTKSSDAGIQWFTSSPTIAAGTDFSLRQVPGLLPEKPERPAGGGLGIGILDMNIDVAISLLATSNDLNLLSTPYLVTMDNQWADIEVGDQIPYKKLNEFGVTSYEFKDATIRLSLKPHINNDSTITIQLEPQANFQQGFTPDGVPIIATRKARTQVSIKSGETLVIGGIMQESDVVTETRVPVLGSLPYIGRLFKFSKVSRQKTELVVMLMPEIVKPDQINQNAETDPRIPEAIRKKLNEQ